MKVKDIKVIDIVPYEKNPRKNDSAVEAVANSISEFWFKVPLVITKDNVIVAGHTRYKAALRLGLESVPCIIADDLNDEQIKAFRLADNKVGEIAEWDIDLLGEELQGIADIDMECFGFDMSALQSEKIVVDDEPPKVDEEDHLCESGDVWILGKHRLVCGDSCDTAVLDTLMDGCSADLLVTDPPYNVALGNHDRPSEAKQLHRRTDGLVIANDSFETEDEYSVFLSKSIGNAKNHLKDGGAFYVWYATSQTIPTIKGLHDAGLTERQILIWVKNTFALGRQDYQWMYEPCLYGWKDGAAHYFVSRRNIPTVIDDGLDLDIMSKTELHDKLQQIIDYTSILYEDKPTRSEDHPTMKPVRLISKLIMNSSRIGESVLDCFGGSGTTLIACEQLGRRCFMVELDTHYSAVIVKRYIEQVGTSDEVFVIRNGEKLKYKDVVLED